MANTVDKVLKVAEAEVDYLEKKSDSQLDSKTANAGFNNYTKYGKEMHQIYPAVMDYPAPWCDAFVDWCFQKAYGVANAKGLLCGNFDDYTVASKQLYVNKQAYYKSNPQIGDQIFFRNSTGVCHTGLVYKVDSKRVYTIEGNTSSVAGVVPNGGGVFKKSYELGSSNIDGYGRPKYDVIKADATPKKEVADKTKKATTKTTAKKSYNGSFPNMPSRGYFTKNDKGNGVVAIQKFLLWYDPNCLPQWGADGSYGNETIKAVKKFQAEVGFKGADIDGEFGTKTLAKAKSFKK